MKNLLEGWIVQTWKKEDADAQIIKLQKTFICTLVAFCLILSYGWMSAPSRLTVFIPPDIQNGATIKAGSIPLTSIYSFTYQIWQEINFWQDGIVDYQKNIQNYWPYLTPNFTQQLLEDYQDLKLAGQLQRKRYLQGQSGGSFEISSIKILSDSSWVVNLKMRLIEYKNNQIIKDAEILYPLKVIRTNLSQDHNPYNLQLDGFISEPKRLLTYV